jgi:hypothetical protein
MDEPAVCLGCGGQCIGSGGWPVLAYGIATCSACGHGNCARAGRVIEVCDEPDPLHPNGRCTCHGEGTCELCKKWQAEERAHVCAENLDELLKDTKRVGWRVGSKVGRTVYNEHDDLIGVMDTPALAARVVEAVNSHDAAGGGEPMSACCRWCGELIRATDHPSDVAFMHYECGARAVIGSVGHIEGKCSCYGGTEEDPPELTRRQAAQAALDAYRKVMAKEAKP